jgi:hypothetical protein
MHALGTWWMLRFILDARVAHCPSVCIIRHTAPKGRKALAGSELYRGVDKINAVGTVLLEIEDRG